MSDFRPAACLPGACPGIRTVRALAASLAATKLWSGVLIAPFKVRLPSQRTCHLVYPRQHLNKPAVKLFRDWLFEELRLSPPTFCKKP